MEKTQLIELNDRLELVSFELKDVHDSLKNGKRKLDNHIILFAKHVLAENLRLVYNKVKVHNWTPYKKIPIIITTEKIN